MYADYKAECGSAIMDRVEVTSAGDNTEAENTMAATGPATARTPRRSPKSSVVIIPPEHLSTQIQQIREKHDKGYIRWMPHINMLWPFLEDINDGAVFLEAKDKLTAGLAKVKPFRVSFSKDSFGYFEHKKFCTLWLKPLDDEEVAAAKMAEADRVLEGKTNDVSDNKIENGTTGDLREAEDETHDNSNSIVADQSNSAAGTNMEADYADVKPKKRKQKKKKPSVQRPNPHRPHIPFHSGVISLQKHLEGIFPDCNDLGSHHEGFKPHLSLGQFKAKTVEEDLAKFQGDWEEFSFEVKEVYLISRKDFEDPFHVRHTIPLGLGEH